MRNWSTSTTQLKKDLKSYKRWETEQLLTYGLDEGDTLDKEYIRNNLDNLNIPQDMREYLEYLFTDDEWRIFQQINSPKDSYDHQKAQAR